MRSDEDWEGLTRRDRVLAVLEAAAGRWVYGPELANVAVGGSEGLRRVRELYAMGYQVERRRRPGRQGWEYRLVTGPYQGTLW